MSDDHKGPAMGRENLYQSRPGRTGSPTPPEGGLTAKDLLALPDGARVKDVTGDRWEKRDGWWYCYDAALRGEALLRVWGPVTRTDEPAIVTYGEDQG